LVKASLRNRFFSTSKFVSLAFPKTIFNFVENGD
jgi:hypothetical protein